MIYDPDRGVEKDGIGKQENATIEVLFVNNVTQLIINNGEGRVGLELSKDSVGMLIDELTKCFNLMD